MRDETVGHKPRASHRLPDVFSVECVEILPAGQDKGSVLARLVTSIAHAGHVEFDQVNQVVQALESRETMGTTALGNGLALPHARTGAVRCHVGAIGAAPGGVDLASLDGLPTRLVFLILSPQKDTTGHLRILEQLAKLMRDPALHRSLQVERTPEALLAFLGITDDGFVPS